MMITMMNILMTGAEGQCTWRESWLNSHECIDLVICISFSPILCTADVSTGRRFTARRAQPLSAVKFTSHVTSLTHQDRLHFDFFPPFLFFSFFSGYYLFRFSFCRCSHWCGRRFGGDRMVPWPGQATIDVYELKCDVGLGRNSASIDIVQPV